jgi:hypothetical protein
MFEPQGELAQDVGDAGLRIPSPNIGDPLAEDRAVDERVQPHGLADSRALEGDPDDLVLRDVGDLAGGEHLNVVIGLAEKRVFEVDHFAFHVEGHDLALSPGHAFVADRETLEQQAGMRRPVALADDILMGLHGFYGMGQGHDRGAVPLVEPGPVGQLSNQRLERRFLSVGVCSVSHWNP